MFRLFVFAIALVSLAAGAAAPPADLDAYVARAMKEFDVPGIGIAIVKDGKPVLMKGYGVRRNDSPLAVDERTLFGIASNTKAFTATALAMLVDEGKLKWDDPVERYLPNFRMAEPYVSREVTVRDLLSHRTGLGLGAGDLLFWPDTLTTRNEVVEAARWIKPASSFRSRYAYNNLAFVVAGEVVRAISGKPWEDFIRERIFAPLGMAGTRITSIGFKPGDNVAWPHSRGWRLEGTLRPISPAKDEVWAAAAGIKTSPTDIAKWMAAHLANGKTPDGKALWSEKAEADLQSANTLQTVRERQGALKPLSAQFSAYALGFNLRDYKGRKIVSHTGGLTGMVSEIWMIPSEKLGIAIFTNQEEGGAMESIGWHIIQHFLDEPAGDWIGPFKAASEEQRAKANAAEKKAATERNAQSKPSLALEKYAGTYQDAWYGKASLALENGKLVLRMARTPAMTGDLEHWQYDTFKAVFRDNTIPDAFVTFKLDAAGRIAEMNMEAVSQLADFSFDYQDLSFRKAGN